MNTLLRWCFLALIACSVLACETDDDADNPTGGGLPISNADYEFNGNWQHSGRFAGYGNTSFRGDRYGFVKSTNEDFTVQLSSQVLVKFWIHDANDRPVKGFVSGLEHTEVISELDSGYYEVIVFTHTLQETGTINYNLKFFGNISEPRLITSKTVDLTGQELPVDPSNSDRSTWLYYEFDFKDMSRQEAIDVIAESEHDLKIQFFESNNWRSMISSNPGKQVFLLRSQWDPNIPFYFRIGAEFFSTPPSSKFDISINARDFNLIEHGTNDPT